MGLLFFGSPPKPRRVRFFLTVATGTMLLLPGATVAVLGLMVVLVSVSRAAAAALLVILPQ